MRVRRSSLPRLLALGVAACVTLASCDAPQPTSPAAADATAGRLALDVQASARNADVAWRADCRPSRSPRR